ncbi:DUF3592 domain-containing protein [Streptomyces sp. NPDC051976]|uniref:DUF3592 domain-containing protein n=1 Tax=Streptomyces sp. NPDC051976 TaxID=3154947 RepID=UPI00344800AB
MRWDRPAPSCSSGNCTGTPVDNTLPYVIFACVGAAIALYVIGRIVIATRRKQLLAHGIRADAVISAIDSRAIVANGTNAKVDVTLTVRSTEGEEFEGWTTAVFPVAALPEAGWTVPVRYWARNPQRIAVDGAAVPPSPPPQPA